MLGETFDLTSKVLAHTEKKNKQVNKTNINLLDFFLRYHIKAFCILKHTL